MATQRKRTPPPEQPPARRGRGALVLALLAIVLVVAGVLYRRSGSGAHAGTPPEPDPIETRDTPQPTGTSPPSPLLAQDLPIKQGVVSELAELDKAFEDQRGGAGWSNLCVMHFSRNRLAFAKAACERGLAMKPAVGTLGEILYTLGLIEEKAGNTNLAATYFNQALAVAPGSAKAVESSLADLTGLRPPPRASLKTSSSGAPLPIPSRLQFNDPRQR